MNSETLTLQLPLLGYAQAITLCPNTQEPVITYTIEVVRSKFQEMEHISVTYVTARIEHIRAPFPHFLCISKM